MERLNALQAPALYGYATMLHRLADEQRAGRLRITPLAVTSTSETLTPAARAAITEAFGVPVIDTFGSTEGLVGTSAPGDEVLVFNSDVCIVELVDADDQPVPPGLPSAKVLVTNLSNLTQPLIRYELNDVFVREPDSPDHGHLRATVRGRADDLLRYDDGVHVHPGVIRSVLLQRPEIADYLVFQHPRGIEVHAIAAEPVDVDVLTRALVDALAGTGLPAADVQVRIVESLPRDSATGKLRRFVPLG